MNKKQANYLFSIREVERLPERPRVTRPQVELAISREARRLTIGAVCVCLNYGRPIAYSSNKYWYTLEFYINRVKFLTQGNTQMFICPCFSGSPHDIGLESIKLVVYQPFSSKTKLQINGSQLRH